MKKTLCFILLIVPMLSLAKGHGHKPVKMADVTPDVEVVEDVEDEKISNIEKEDNYQLSLERNAYDFGDFYTPSFTADIGNWNVQLSVQNLLLSGSNASAATYLNVAYTYPIYEYFALSAGTMNGTVLTGVTIQSFNYVSTVFMLPKWGVTWSIGPYYANSAMTGIVTAQNQSVDSIGLTTGLGYVQDKWVANATYISSYSNVGGLNMDVGYKFGPVTPYIGWGVSTPAPIQNTDSDSGIISMQKSPLFCYYSLGLNLNF